MSKVDFRYRRYGYTALNVTDIERTTAFATDVFAMDMSGEGPNGERFFRCSPSHHDVVLYPSKSAAFVRCGWELESEDDLDRAFAHYERLGLKPVWISREESVSLALERAFRVRDPIYGVCFEYYARMVYISTPRKNSSTSFYGQGHLGLCIPDTRKMTEYMVDNMGFLLSDYVRDYWGTLLRAFPNPNHHSFAPLSTPAGKLAFHHHAFMVNSIDDIGKLFNRAKKFDTKIQFGMGRHPTSGSIHLYLYDPDFFVWEYTLGMEQFPEINPREPRLMSLAPEDFDLWGAVPDKEFAGRNPPVLTE